MVSTGGFDPPILGSNPGGTYIHRSLMARIAGFHPADPGSIPGDEVRLRMTLKAPKIVYSKKIKKNRYTVFTRETSFLRDLYNTWPC